MDSEKSGNIVLGENSDNPLYSNAKIKTHAEMNAMNKLNKSINTMFYKQNKKVKVNLIVIRINKLGELCESAPCFHCTQQLASNDCIQINKLYYSRSNRTISCIKFSHWVKYGDKKITSGWRNYLKNSKKSNK